MMGQCISFNALGLVRTAKIVLRGHPCLPKRIPRNFIYRPFLCGFNAALGFKVCKTSPHQITPILRVYFEQIRLNSMVDVTTSGFFGMRGFRTRLYMTVW